MMRCPLPIDWLEYLEGTASEALFLHLQECRPCRLLVEELRRESHSPELIASGVPQPESWPRWRETRPLSPAFGEIWWSTQFREPDSDPTGRVLLLILSDPWTEKSRSWVEVVPLATDIENATSLDLVLTRGDTDMNVPWRVLFRYQTIVERDEIDSRIGDLTATGRVIIKDALTGRASEERFGSPISGAEDSRIQPPQWMQESIRLLGRAYARMLEENEAHSPARVVSFTMRPTVRFTDVAQNLSFAAASTVEEYRSWVVEIPEKGRLRGRIEHRFLDDELLFVIEEVVEEPLDLPSTARITFWSDRLQAPVTSPPFRPAVGEQVTLGDGYGIVPGDISRLELRVPDES